MYNSNIIASEHTSFMAIQMKGEPVEYERPQLLSKNQLDKLFQSLKMMHFQQQVMHIASAKLTHGNLLVFQNPVSVEITIVTSVLNKDINLEFAVKSILDGMNKTVIQDDDLIMNIQIWLEKSNKSYVKSYAKVTVNDSVTNASITFQIDGPVVEKALAILLNVGFEKLSIEP